MRSTGKALITLGLLTLAFVGYLLWGTSIEYSRAQNDLDEQWERLAGGTTIVPETSPTWASSPPTISGATPVTPTTVAVITGSSVLTTPATTTTPTSPPTTAAAAPGQQIPIPERGDVVARLTIPAIGLRNENVVSGVGVEDLKKGPGHFPETPLPGQLGNAALAGHRTTYGAPFYDVDEIDLGDEIIVETLAGTYVYHMTGSEIVDPSDYRVISTTEPTRATLTLVSCHPKRSAKQRIVISAQLDTTVSSPVGAMTSNYQAIENGGQAAQTTSLPGDSLPPDSEPASTTVAPTTESTTAQTDSSVIAAGSESTGTSDTESAALPVGEASNAEPLVGNSSASAFSRGWFGDAQAWPHIVLWGALLSGIASGAHVVNKRTRTAWVGGLAAVIPFVVVLYFFFQNVNRLLPPGL